MKLLTSLEFIRVNIAKIAQFTKVSWFLSSESLPWTIQHSTSSWLCCYTCPLARRGQVRAPPTTLGPRVCPGPRGRSRPQARAGQASSPLETNPTLWDLTDNSTPFRDRGSCKAVCVIISWHWAIFQAGPALRTADSDVQEVLHRNQQGAEAPLCHDVWLMRSWAQKTLAIMVRLSYV